MCIKTRNSNGSYPVPYIGLKYVPVCFGLSTMFHILNTHYYVGTKNYSKERRKICKLGQ